MEEIGSPLPSGPEISTKSKYSNIGMGNPPYIYTPLDSDADEIHLVIYFVVHETLITKAS